MNSLISSGSSFTAAAPRAHSRLWIAQVVLLPLSLLSFAVGSVTADPETMAFGVFFLYGFGICYICQDLRSRVFLLFLFIGIFLFWLTRPLLSMLYQTDTWLGTTLDSTAFALGSIYLSIGSLLIGSELYTRLCRKSQRVCSLDLVGQVNGKKRIEHALGAIYHQNESALLLALRHASLVAYGVCFLGAAVYGVQLLSYMNGLTYLDFYLTSSSEYTSSFVSSLANLSPAALCCYLATMPRRSSATVALLANILTTLPRLLIGARVDFVMAALFLVLYYMLRNARDGRGSWIGKKEVALALLLVPIGIAGLGAINFIRGGIEYEESGLLFQLTDPLYSQGVTFKVLEYGYEVQPQISALGFKFFSLGPLIGTITQGFIGQLFLGCDLLPEVNSVELALRGTSYSHTMSYFAHSNYLGGQGYGSSYILELYADFGWGGIIVGSIFLGVLFTAAAGWVGKGWLSTAIILMGARRVFFMPRGEFVEWASSLWSTRFWLLIVLIAFGALLLAVFFRRRNKGLLHGYGGLEMRAFSWGNASEGPRTNFASPLDGKSCSQNTVKLLSLATEKNRKERLGTLND